MAQFTQSEPSRPAMRRKSSAQNLLSSFKSASSSTTQVTSPVLSSTTLSYTIASTPTVSTPRGEWDAQSLHSESLPQSQGVQGTSVEYLKDLVQKRIITLTYIRSVHEGRSHWFHTILMTRQDLDRAFNNNDMKKQTFRYATLGMSLSNLLDINQPQDLLRGIIHTLAEHDQAKEDTDKSKIRQPRRLFRTNKAGKRQGGGFSEYAGGYSGSDEASYLIIPQVPFPLDYHQTLLSLLDVLSEVYNKISKILGPSAFPHASQQMMGPLGQLAPHPGVTYLFSGEGNSHPYQNHPNSSHQSNPSLAHPSFASETELNSSLWGIANASINSGGMGAFMYGGGLASPPITWTPNFGEMVLKIDGKFKKITSSLLKELDGVARKGITDELSSLDPLLRNMNIDDGAGKSIYNFE